MLPESAPKLLADATLQLGIDLTPPQVQALLGHLSLLAKWNKVYNLTAVRDTGRMLHQHLIDSLAAVPALDRHLRTTGADGVQGLVDVGSGAGFPGVAFAIALPALQVCCVDTVGKKASFLRQVAAELSIGNLRAEHARIEEMPPLEAAVVTSRAFASLSDFTALTRQHLSGAGVWMAMKARHPAAEIAELPKDIDVFHVEQLTVPGLDAERCLVWMRPRR